jgi:hypothetical protein
MKEQPPLGPRHLFEYEFSHAAPETPGNALPAGKGLPSAFQSKSFNPSCETAGAGASWALVSVRHRYFVLDFEFDSQQRAFTILREVRFP